jgi:Flp pilus assembly protein CpaB
VDVLTSYKPANANEAVTKTLLQNIQVLGIEGDTIVSAQENKRPGTTDRNKKRMVTLMVDPEQAKVLQSAIQEGTISLSMRNPLDAAALVEPKHTVEAPPEPKSVVKAESAQTKPADAEDSMWEVGVLRQGRLSEVVKFKQLRGAS